MPFRRALLTLALLPAIAAADLHYTLAPEPQHKSVRVTIVVEKPNATETFRIPAWCPGFYFLLNYEKKISDFKAVDGAGKELAVEHGFDPRQWTVKDPSKKPITISYRVLGDDPGLGFFGTSVIAHTAFVNGPSAFMYDPERLTEPVSLKVTLPDRWDIATSMDSAPGGYKASGYDELADHPIQMGHFERRKFEIKRVPFEVIFVSKDQQYRPNLTDETERLRRLSAPAIELFGGAPFKRYVYIFHLAVGDFNGGLEHRASNTQAINNTRPLGIDELATHEYFHAWNVKNIRPKVLGPFDYTRPNRTSNLWFAEGVTDYYAYLTAYRTGLHDANWLMRSISGQIRDLQRSKVRLQKTLAQSSSETWENGGFGIGDLSYYTKGLLVGWIFDAAIRGATNGQKSLDDVMRLMYARYRLPQVGYAEDGILNAINEVGGTDFTELYHRMVDSTDDLPYEQVRQMGLVLDPDLNAVFDVSADTKAVKLRNGWLSRAGSVGQ